MFFKNSLAYGGLPNQWWVISNFANVLIYTTLLTLYILYITLLFIQHK